MLRNLEFRVLRVEDGTEGRVFTWKSGFVVGDNKEAVIDFQSRNNSDLKWDRGSYDRSGLGLNY